MRSWIPPGRPVFVDLPSEDPDHKDMCAQLLRHMYGTRGAADGWQVEYSCTPIGFGFLQGESCPNVFCHPEKDVCAPVDADDFTATGPEDDLIWMEVKMRASHKSKSKHLGPGEHQSKRSVF